jgi:hypothetical protein
MVLLEEIVVDPATPVEVRTPAPTAKGWWSVTPPLGYAIGFALVLGMIVSSILTSR